MDQNNRKSGGNLSATFAIRCIAALFVFYSLWDIVSAYLAGGEDAPTLTMLLLAIAVLGGGGVFIALMAWKEWKKTGSAQEKPAEEPTQLPDQTEE